MTPPALILRAVALEYGVRVPDILGRDRHRTIASARRIASYLLRIDGRSYPEIAVELCQAHHASAMLHYRTVNAARREDGALRALLARVVCRIEVLRRAPNGHAVAMTEAA